MVSWGSRSIAVRLSSRQRPRISPQYCPEQTKTPVGVLINLSGPKGPWLEITAPLGEKRPHSILSTAFQMLTSTQRHQVHGWHGCAGAGDQDLTRLENSSGKSQHWGWVGTTRTLTTTGPTSIAGPVQVTYISFITIKTLRFRQHASPRVS